MKICDLRMITLCTGLLAFAGCSHDRGGPSTCDGALGVHRTVTLTADTPPPADMLHQNEVILSFDDGPHPLRTGRVLDLLASECTKATFFLIGSSANQHPRIVQQILADGHSIGGHSWSHPNLSEMTIDEAMTEITRGNTAIFAATDRPVRLFRFPFIATTPELSDAIRAEGLIDVTVTIDGADWTNHSPERSVAMIMNKLNANQRRGIVLLHDTFARSDERTRILLQSLKSEGYRVVAVSDSDG